MRKAALLHTALFLGACLQPLTESSDDVNPLEAVVAQLSQQLTSLQARVTQQDDRAVAMETLLHQQATTITGLQGDVATLKGQMALQTPLTAFDVHFKDDPHGSVDDHEIMKFDSVATNIGNAYNANNGMFQAPVSGFYLFYFKVTPHPNGHIYVYLAKEGTNVDSAMATDTTHQESGHSVTVLHVTKGERVWLVKNDGVTSVRGWAHTKLAGFLLRAT